MFSHSVEASDEQVANCEVEEEEVLENQCHICREQLPCQDDFLDHVGSIHFRGMMEAWLVINV